MCPQPPARAASPRAFRPYAIEPVPAMRTIPAASPAPATSAMSASLTTRTRECRAMRRMMADTVRASSSRSTPAMPRQMAAGVMSRSPIAVSITSCRTFSTASSPAACSFAPGPGLSETIAPCASASRHTVLVPPASMPNTCIAPILPAVASLVLCYAPKPSRHGADLDRLPGDRRVPARDHRLRLLLRALSADHPRLLPDRTLGAVVGDLLHDRGDGNEHAHLHQRAGDRVQQRYDVPAARGGLRHRPAAGERDLHSRLLPGRSVHVVRAAAAAVRPARQESVGHHLSDHARP